MSKYKRFLVSLLVAVLATGSAMPFCGFYVSRADTKGHQRNLQCVGAVRDTENPDAAQFCRQFRLKCSQRRPSNEH